jgi:2-C-methyl-D-erythritol 4-phosphate cytidylyltransferase/2-C-methyl-D-erythritol 2,4-cyclodiphosphate synthase
MRKKPRRLSTRFSLPSKAATPVTLSVIVVAAGSGTRLGSSLPKAFVDVGGRTILERSLLPLATLSDCDVVIVAPEAWVSAAEDLAQKALSGARVTVVAGGNSRTDSVRAGLATISDSTTVLLVHDAARATTPAEVFTRVIDAVQGGAKGVIPTLDVVDTIVSKNGTAGATGAAIDRSQLLITQTPQGFDREALVAAYEGFEGEATDDAEVLRHAGYEVVAVEGHRDAHKITYPHDLARLEAPADSSELRSGIGIDVHRFEDGRPMVVGGHTFESSKGLSGHSDGDVVLHAIVDALLGAAGLGDLGSHFGTSRPEFDGADSTVFISHTLSVLGEAGLAPQSVSVQYVANEPKIGPVREHISVALTELVGAPVHVSATTTDGLGLTGRGEGAMAIATALVVRHKAQ